MGGTYFFSRCSRDTEKQSQSIRYEVMVIIMDTLSEKHAMEGRLTEKIKRKKHEGKRGKRRHFGIR